MNTSMKWRLLAAPVALALLGLPAFGCDQVAEAQGTLCCTEFTPGADLSGVDWKIEGDQKVSFGAFMQAAADFTGAASAAVNDVAAACQALALDLDPMAKEDAVKETDPAKRATAWCKLATDQLNAKVKGNIQIAYQPPSCSVSVNAQASCEAKCTVDAMCQAELGKVEVRCDPGQLSGKCDADCTAKCEGSANLAVSCDGTCDGTCEGMCDGKASGGAASGRCAGTCSGKCRGTCQVAAGAKVSCEGECTGGCSVAVRAPKCKGELKPPSASCMADAECSGSCKASASAKAECREPSLEIESSLDPKIIASLKLNLPKILSIADARGKILVENAKAVADFGADFTASADISKVSLKAGACVVPAVNAMTAAVANVQASVTGSAGIVAAIK